MLALMSLALCVSCSSEPHTTQPTVAAPATSAIVRSAEPSAPPRTTRPPEVATAEAPTPPAPSSEPDGVMLDGVCFPRAVKIHAQPTDAEAVGAFRRGWRGCVRPDDPALSSHARPITDSMEMGQHPFLTKKAPCRTLKADLEKRTSGLSSKLMVLGTLTSLDRDGSCFSVRFAGGMKREAEGVLDAKNLALYFAWIIPEG